MGAGASSKRTVRGQARLDRWLSLFTEVHRGEGAGALLLTANVFCLLGSYYLLKTVREALILSEGGAEVKSYAAGAQAIVLLLAVPAYGALASRVNRIRLINGVMLFFVSHLVVFHQLAAHGVHIGVPFFLWVGIFNLMAVAQFWAFANDLYTSERGQRLFPLVGIGASLGAWVGARLASRLMAAHAGPSQLLLLAAVGLMICIGLVHCVNHRERRHRSGPAGQAQADEPVGPAGGFRLILTSRYLRLMALMVILVNMVNTIGEFLLGKLVVAQVSRALADGAAAGLTRSQLIGIFYGDFFGWVNLASLFIQLFVVSRVFKRVGVRGALFVLPFVAFVSYGVLALLPVLAAVRIGKIVENSTDYSLQNTARHALFLPTSREAKYKAKQAIDGFFWRAGDVLQAIVIFVGVRLAFGVPQFAMLNQLLVAIWLAVIVVIYREHKRLVAVAEPERIAA
jgi:AAA family ATP:ADP antiporter